MISCRGHTWPEAIAYGSPKADALRAVNVLPRRGAELHKRSAEASRVDGPQSEALDYLTEQVCEVIEGKISISACVSIAGKAMRLWEVLNLGWWIGVFDDDELPVVRTIPKILVETRIQIGAAKIIGSARFICVAVRFAVRQ